MTPIELLHRRAEKAWGAASLHHGALREAYYWFAPERYYEMVSTGTGSNRAVYDHIFDPVGMQALEDGASQIAEALHPWDQEWSRWVAKKGISEEQRKEVEQATELMSDFCSSKLARSNFDAAAPASHKEFLFGTAFMLMDRDDRDPAQIRFTPTPAYQWAIEADSAGRLTAAFRKVKSKARDLDATVPNGKFSDQVRQQQKQNPDTEIELMFATWWDRERRLWHTCFYETVTKHPCWKQRVLSRTCPVIVYRQGLVAGQAWGKGPALKALPDVKTVNKVAELILRNAAISITGIWQAEDDGVLNPHNVRLVPGAIIPIAQGSGGLRPLEAPGNFDLSQFIMEELRVNVRRAMYVTRVEERDMTAEEYRGRLNQQLREQRGMYGQLKSEFADQVMFRMIDLAEQTGEIPASAFSALAEVELTGPLAMDVRGAEVERFKAAYYDIAGTAGPDVAMASIAVEKLPEWIAQQRHAPSELFRSETQMKGMVEQIMAMAAQQQTAPAEAA